MFPSTHPPPPPPRAPPTPKKKEQVAACVEFAGCKKKKTIAEGFGSSRQVVTAKVPRKEGNSVRQYPNCMTVSRKYQVAHGQKKYMTT